MSLSVFAEFRLVSASPVVHGVSPLAEARGRALHCDVGVNASLLSHRVRVVGGMDPGTCEIPVEPTSDLVDCMACLVAAAVAK